MRKNIMTALLLSVLLVTAGCASNGSGSGEKAAGTADVQKTGSSSETGAGDVKKTDGVDNTSNSDDGESARMAALMDDSDRGLFLLVNKQHTIGADYAPDDLVQVDYVASDRSPSGWNMRKEAAEHFNELSEAAAEDGCEIVVTTAYRSYAFQKSLWDSYVAQDGEALASTYSARPGTSEHQTGLAADVSSPDVGYAIGTSVHYEDTKPGRWLAENCYRFGFIIRFPDGDDDITGYTYEPWHIRYVGTTAAKEIFDAGITLEEYLEQNPFLNIG